MAITEGVWDCSSCNTTNRGRDRVCISCSNPREENELCRPLDGAPPITDTELLAQAMQGADWHCRGCGSGNAANDSECRGCGAPREAKSAERNIGIYVPPEGRSELRSMAADISDSPGRSSIPWPWILGGSFLSLLFVGLIYAIFFRVGSYEGVVASKTWELQIPIEQIVDRPGRGWDVPEGAVVTSQHMAVKGQRQVQVGTVTKTKMVEVREKVGTKKVKTGRKIDLGNGFFKDEEIDEPIYRTKKVPKTYEEPVMRTEDVIRPYYNYTEKVAERRFVKAIGTFAAPSKPQFALASNERELEHVNVFTVMLMVGGKEYPYHPKDAEEWQRFKEGERCTVHMTQAGTIKKVE